jgi:hypothetical protein
MRLARFLLLSTLLAPLTATGNTAVQDEATRPSSIPEVGFGTEALRRWPMAPSTGLNARRREPATQTEAVWQAWLAANPDKAAAARRYQSYLAQQGVGDVFPLRQLAKGCGLPDVPHLAFDIPPESLWPNIVPTLAFIRDHVIPAVGPVMPYHAYRNPQANAACGSRAGTHPRNLSVDVVPLELDSPAEIERRLCMVWLREGLAARVGMGFYGTGAIHVDTWRYRSWGPDTRGATSPCPPR